jgi:hypothetical protein
MVEEDEYRSTYQALNRRRCAFEKALLSHRCACVYSTRFYLADREGVCCDSQQLHQRCVCFISLLREKARFALRVTSVAPQLPHAKEIKVQNGGLLGLQRIVRPGLATDRVNDIAGLLAKALQTCGTLERLPYPDIIKAIVSFEGRKRPRSKR